MIAQYETSLACRKRDENGDMLFGNSLNDYVGGLEAMVLVIQSRLRAIQGEWWEGDETALPYFGEILNAYQTEKNRAIIDLMVVERIMDTRGVVSIPDVHSQYIGRKYVFQCTVNTLYGTAPVEVTL